MLGAIDQTASVAAYDPQMRTRVLLFTDMQDDPSAKPSDYSGDKHLFTGDSKAMALFVDESGGGEWKARVGPTSRCCSWGDPAGLHPRQAKVILSRPNIKAGSSRRGAQEGHAVRGGGREVAFQYSVRSGDRERDGRAGVGGKDDGQREAVPLDFPVAADGAVRRLMHGPRPTQIPDGPRMHDDMLKPWTFRIGGKAGQDFITPGADVPKHDVVER